MRFPDPPRTVGDFDLVRKGLSGTDGGHWKMEIFSNGKGYCQFRGSSGTVTVNAGPRLDDDRWHRISCVKRTRQRHPRRRREELHPAQAGRGDQQPRVPGRRRQGLGGGDWYRGLMDEVSIKLG